MFLDRYVRSKLTAADEAFLAKNGQSYSEIGDYQFTGYATRWAARINPTADLSYLILRGLQAVGLIWDIREPPKSILTEGR